MAREEIENLTTEMLIKRKKLNTAILVILLFAAIADIIMFLYDLMWDEKFKASLLVSFGALVVISIALYIGKKKILEELERRKVS
jgi:hypothetical protein